jgi:hypothetical protein
LLEALGLSDTDYNWNISQAAISYKSLDNNFMEITFNIQKMESNLWVELTKIWAPVEFSASDSCRVLNSIDVDVYNKLEAMMLSITIQKLSSDNKTSFYLNKNLRIAMWAGVTMCAGFAFWNISSDYYRMSGFSIGATMLYAAMFFGPVYWFFNKKILKRKCPNCLALFSTDTPSQELLGSQEITLGTIDVEAGKVHSKSGQHIATLTEKRENKTTISTYRYYHCCDRCNFVWNTVDSSMALIGHVGSRI